MLYKIFIGTDTATKPIINEQYIGIYNNLEDAMKSYKKCQDKCKKMCSVSKYQYNRNYCYMIEINPDKKLIGHLDGKEIDNGCEAYTLYAHSYSAHPELHIMLTTENKKTFYKY